MKLIEKILNNYFNNIYKRKLKEIILLTFILDVEIKEDKYGGCELLLKPVKFKNYTPFYHWNKKNSLNHLINFEKEIKKLLEHIKDMDWSIYI